MNKATPLAVAIMFATILCGCKEKEEGFTFNRRFSVNVAKPQRKWPGNPEKNLTPAQQDVLALRGRPDWLRFWWKGADDFATSSEIPAHEDPAMFEDIPQSWIYLRRGLSDEVVFNSAVSSDSVPLSDRLTVVLKEGDPQDRKLLPSRHGGADETWHYYSSGMVYQFLEGKLIKAERQHEPLPWTMR
jgi:hypothetical protein